MLKFMRVTQDEQLLLLPALLYTYTRVASVGSPALLQGLS